MHMGILSDGSIPDNIVIGFGGYSDQNVPVHEIPSHVPGTVHQVHYYYPMVTPIPKEKEFVLPKWNLIDTKWSEFYSKLATALHHHDMGQLMFETHTTPENHHYLKKLCYNLYDKLHN